MNEKRFLNLKKSMTCQSHDCTLCILIAVGFNVNLYILLQFLSMDRFYLLTRKKNQKPEEKLPIIHFKPIVNRNISDTLFKVYSSTRIMDI